jgi:hypothetical protein
MYKPKIMRNDAHKIVALIIILIVASVTVSIILPSLETSLKKTPPLTQFSPGDYVTFGRYLQTSAEIKEPIVWRVLAVDESEIFLLSEKILFYAPFDEIPSDYSYREAGFKSPDIIGAYYSGYWPDSTIRAYLNGTDTSDPDLYPHIGKNCAGDSFKTDAFIGEEWGAIKETELATAKEWTENGGGQGEKTSDKVFLLSSSEVVRFFPKYTDRQTQMTAFAKTQFSPDPSDMLGESEYIRSYGYWLTRTYYNPHLVACVSARGGGEEPGHEVGSALAGTNCGVRPAIKLDLDAPDIYALVKPAQAPAPVPLLEEIVIDVGSRNIYRGDTFVRNNIIQLEKSPVVPRTVTEGNPMLPFAHICRVALGGATIYEDETRTLVVRVKGHELLLQMDNPVMTVNGAEIELSKPPIIFKGYVFAPLDAFEPVVTSIKWFNLVDNVRIFP